MRRLFASQVAQSLMLLLLLGLYLATVIPHLEDDPIAGGDEGWIISASAKLAAEGVFGTDLFAGFYGADDHYYFNLPLHHLVLAGVFKLFGVGLAQARMVSVAYGLGTLLLTYAIGRKLAGSGVGLVAAALLVLLRLNLAPFSGLTLTDLGATVRYDLIAVPYGLAAVLLLLHAGPQPKALAVAGAGFLVGLSALTQFVGAFFGLPLALYLLTTALPFSRRLLLACLLAVAAALPFLPYAANVSQDWGDFRGQARTVEQESDLTSPSFYWRQLSREPDRYAIAMDLQEMPSSLSQVAAKPSARLALLVVAPLALLWTLGRGRSDLAFRLLGLTLLMLLLQLALFESTKRFVYWVVAVPFLCVAIADLARAVWQWAPRPDGRRWLSQGLVMLVLGIFTAEGVAVAAKDMRDAPDATRYEELGRRIEAELTPNAVVLGDNRLWPALPNTRLRSLLLLFYETNPRISRERTTDITGVLERINPDYVVLSPLSREILAKLSEKDGDDFRRYMSSSTERVATIDYRGYGTTEVFRVRKVGLASAAGARRSDLTPRPPLPLGRGGDRTRGVGHEPSAVTAASVCGGLFSDEELT
jgi:4-amino-4-deoxy-L-arabinose transferase-like glycosyltransferase